MTKINKGNYLSEEEIALWSNYQKNPEDGNALSAVIEFYLPVVHRVLARMTINLPSFVSVQDLMQSAVLGLYHSVTRFDTSQGKSFEAFAVPRIKGAIYDELRGMDHMSRHTRSQIKKLEEAINSLRQKHGRTPDEHEIAQNMGISESILAFLLDQAQPWLSLDDIMVETDDGSITLKELLTDTSVKDAEKETEQEELKELLYKAFLELDAREQKILYLYYYENLRLSEIAQIYELTEARICQLHALAIAKLRVTLAGKIDKEK
jgi:RNA polymerase sigma factor for flagellar operon FliA